MEYCENNLDGFERILKAISSLITDQISVDLFLDAYKFLKAEHVIKESEYEFGKYSPEGLKLAGIPTSKT